MEHADEMVVVSQRGIRLFPRGRRDAAPPENSAASPAVPYAGYHWCLTLPTEAGATAVISRSILGTNNSQLQSDCHPGHARISIPFFPRHLFAE